MKALRGASGAKLVVVIEDDPLVLEALTRLAEIGRRPDLIVCDYRLSEGATGIDAIAGLRSTFEIPALLITADAGSPPGEAAFNGYSLLHKPVDAARFRAALVDASVLQR